MLFASFWLVIIGISAIDTYFSYKYSNILYDLEQNPIGCWLIEADGGDVSLFMSVKMAGTCLAFFISMLVFLYKTHLAIISLAGVCVIWIALLFYMFMG